MIFVGCCSRMDRLNEKKVKNIQVKFFMKKTPPPKAEERDAFGCRSMCIMPSANCFDSPRPRAQECTSRIASICLFTLTR
jgi:hypothetical protein